ncbi:MAG: bifunctional riboflavin kinase/FAD synthetase [Bacilli bacterium]
MNKIDFKLNDMLSLPELSLAIGFFDGVHLGHQRLIDEVRNSIYQPSVLTFSLNMKSGLFSKEPQLLLTEEEKERKLEELGIKYDLVLDFTPDVRDLSVNEFLLLLRNLNCKKIVVGDDFTFGKGGQGKATDLLALEKYGIEVKIISLLLSSGIKVSSTQIKKYLSEGKIQEANQLLGYDYSLEGIVVKGLQNGRKIGFPTANIILPKEKIRLWKGVYKSLTIIDGVKFKSMTNIGNHPTIDTLPEDIVESHVINFRGDLYGKTIKVVFLEKIRDQQKFSSFEELRDQLRCDCLIAKN